VVYDATDPDPNRRYKSALPPNCMAVSPDGVHWTGLETTVPNMDAFTLAFYEAKHQFLVPARYMDRYGRCIRLSTSFDFTSWTDHGVVFGTDERDQQMARQRIERHLADPDLADPEFHRPEDYNAQVYRMGIFGYEGIYIGLPMMFFRSAKVPKDWDGFDEMELSPEVQRLVRTHGDWTGVFEVQLTYSRDLLKWHRLGDRQPFIGPASTGNGAYDTLCISDPGYPILRGDELWFYYSGIKTYAMASLDKKDQGAVCLAVLRRDGFLSLDADKQGGHLLTAPFQLEGRKLFVNHLTSRKGALQIKVLDTQGQLLASSEVMRGDHTRAEVKWANGNLVEQKGKMVQLRFDLQQASLYSYWTGRD